MAESFTCEKKIKKKIRGLFIMLVQDPDIWRLCESINALWHDGPLQLLKTHCYLWDQTCASCWSLGRRFICRHSKSYLYLKLALSGMNFKLVFACWYEAFSFPDKRVLGTFQFSRLTFIHTYNQISSLTIFFFLLREELSLVYSYVSWSQTYHLT